MNISDEQLSRWTRPWFDNQEQRAEKTRDIVKVAVSNHLQDLGIRVVAKGSYPNNTNVRGDSDIDIAVELEDMITLEYAPGIIFSNTGLSNYLGISEVAFKLRLQKALETEFGKNVVDSSGNKVFRIRGSDKIHDADIIPCTTYRYYYAPNPKSFNQGIELILNRPDGIRHSNYPDQHLENGVTKNVSTMKRFKSTTRILKNLNGYIAENTSAILYRSFMIESLAYNIEKTTYIANNSWREIILRGCEEIWTYLQKDEYSLPEIFRWREVNGCKFLFHEQQNWSKDNAKSFIKKVYNLLDN